MQLTHGSLFSGIGGFDLAAEWMGWQNIFHCEWNPFGQTILKHYWPNATTYNDITKTDFSIHRGTIDVLTGGFPCQPYSSAGKRLGKEDDRHLWPEMLRAIREIQPGWVVGENVSGLINWNGGMVFHEVQTDLEAEGYEVQPFLLPACAVNAPHRRDRIWFVAYSDRFNRGRFSPGHEEPKGDLFRQPPKDDGEDEASSDSDFIGLQRPGSFISNKKSERAKATVRGSDRQLIKPGHTNNSISNFRMFPTQPPVCSGNDGFPTKLDGITFSKWRNESIKAGGNAIVPQVAFQIFKAINELTKAS